jgi:hypothetical protein
MTTMKMPENSAVIDTAMFMTLVGTLRSLAIAGAMLRGVWANSQKANTPRIMPKRSLSLPRNGAGVGVIVASLSPSLSGRSSNARAFSIHETLAAPSHT